MLAAMRRASSLVNRLLTERRCGSSLIVVKRQSAEPPEILADKRGTEIREIGQEMLCENADAFIYNNEHVLDRLSDLSLHTSDELQSRIQAVYMWLREPNKKAPPAPREGICFRKRREWPCRG